MCVANHLWTQVMMGSRRWMHFLLHILTIILCYLQFTGLRFQELEVSEASKTSTLIRQQ